MDEARITRIDPAGDPFTAAPTREDGVVHICNDGWITIGQMVIDPETGEEVEEFAQYLCQRCQLRLEEARA